MCGEMKSRVALSRQSEVTQVLMRNRGVGNRAGRANILKAFAVESFMHVRPCLENVVRYLAWKS